MQSKILPEVYLSIAYLPPINYFSKIIAADKVYIEQHENYVKQSFRTRCDIYAANGVLKLNIPVLRNDGKKRPIRDVKIDYSEDWQKLHWKSIVSAYQSSPFFEYFAEDIQPFYTKKEIFLFDFNINLLIKMLELTSIKAEIKFTEDYLLTVNNPEHDFRQSISPKPRLQKPDPYFSVVNYYQVFEYKHGFKSNLSIIDLLCNEGNNSISILQQSLTPKM